MRFWRQRRADTHLVGGGNARAGAVRARRCADTSSGEATDWKTVVLPGDDGRSGSAPGYGSGRGGRKRTWDRLLYWWPALTLAGDLMVAYPRLALSAATIGLGLYTMGLIVFAQMALSYPNGQADARTPRPRFWLYIFIAGYAAQVIQNAYNLAVVDGRGCPYCPPPHERSWLLRRRRRRSLSTGGTGAGRSRSSPSSRSAWRCSGSSSSGSRRADAGRSCRSRSGGL